MLTCKKLWLAMMRASWGPSSSGWAWLLLIPCTNWGILSATAWNEKYSLCIFICYTNETTREKFCKSKKVSESKPAKYILCIKRRCIRKTAWQYLTAVYKLLVWSSIFVGSGSILGSCYGLSCSSRCLLSGDLFIEQKKKEKKETKQFSLQ